MRTTDFTTANLMFWCFFQTILNAFASNLQTRGTCSRVGAQMKRACVQQKDNDAKQSWKMPLARKKIAKGPHSLPRSSFCSVLMQMAIE